MVSLALLAFYLLSDYNPIYSNKEFVYLNIKLKNAQNEDLRRFVEIQTEIYKKTERSECPCDQSTDYISPFRHGYSPTKLLYKLKVEREYSKINCFKFLLLNTDFAHVYADSTRKTFGVKEASIFYFNKNVKDLNEKEILTLIATLKNPSLYDTIRNKEGVKYRVKALEKILRR
jgi:hypothetical protein